MMLEDYELKLNLFSKFQKRMEIIEQYGKAYNWSKNESETDANIFNRIKRIYVGGGKHGI